MMHRKCRICKHTYRAQDTDAMAMKFGYKNRLKTRLVCVCRKCKAEFDRNLNKRKKIKTLHKYRNFIRAKTKSAIKVKYPCSVTNCPNKAELHHFDYEKPLEVLPLCRLHHCAIHRMNRLLDDNFKILPVQSAEKAKGE